MTLWQVIVLLWNWFNVILTLASLAVSLYALYRTLQGSDVVDFTSTFPIVPLTFNEVVSPIVGHTAAVITFEQMNTIYDVTLAFTDVTKEEPSNFDVTVDVAVSPLLDKTILIQVSDATVFPLTPGLHSSTTTTTKLFDNEHMSLMLIWKDSTVMDDLLHGTGDVLFSEVFTTMNMAFISFD